MPTTLDHVRTLKDLEKATTTIENLREGLGDIARNGSDAARDKLLCELANLLHEIGQVQLAMRPGR